MEAGGSQVCRNLSLQSRFGVVAGPAHRARDDRHIRQRMTRSTGDEHDARSEYSAKRRFD
jgi:hypothetical protein